MPPPTPVPQNTPRIVLYGLPAPSLNSASVATDTSLPSATGAPSAFCSSRASGKGASQSFRLPALDTVPRRASICPGDPTPTDASFDVSLPAASAASVRVAAISAATAGGPPVTGVGRRASPTTAPRPFTITAWIFVPPRSMPPRWVIQGAILTGAVPSHPRARPHAPRDGRPAPVDQHHARVHAHRVAPAADAQAPREGRAPIHTGGALAHSERGAPDESQVRAEDGRPRDPPRAAPPLPVAQAQLQPRLGSWPPAARPEADRRGRRRVARRHDPAQSADVRGAVGTDRHRRVVVVEAKPLTGLELEQGAPRA